LGYEILEHTADFKVHGWGNSLEELFADIARGAFSVSAGQEPPTDVRERGKVFEISVEGVDNESLLINFLSELIYLYNVEKVFCWDFEVNISLISTPDQSPHLKLVGKAYALPVQEVEVEIKAATYSGLKVAQTEKGWEATVVFDI